MKVTNDSQQTPLRWFRLSTLRKQTRREGKTEPSSCSCCCRNVWTGWEPQPNILWDSAWCGSVCVCAFHPTESEWSDRWPTPASHSLHFHPSHSLPPPSWPYLSASKKKSYLKGRQRIDKWWSERPWVSSGYGLPSGQPLSCLPPFHKISIILNLRLMSTARNSLKSIFLFEISRFMFIIYIFRFTIHQCSLKQWRVIQLI